jgi:hypothetical protein
MVARYFYFMGDGVPINSRGLETAVETPEIFASDDDFIMHF